MIKKFFILFSMILFCTAVFTVCKEKSGGGEKAITKEEAKKEAEKSITFKNADDMAKKIMQEIEDESK